MTKKFWGNKRKLFFAVFATAILVLGFWANGVWEAKATDYDFLHIKLDTTGGDRDGSCGVIEDCTQLWQFHGFDTLPHDSLDGVTVPADSCAIWLIKENTGFDFGGVVAAPKGQKLSKSGTSVSNDLSGETNLNCDDITSGLTCIYAETLAVANFTYGLVDERGDTQDITLSDSVAATYRPDVDILCAGANNWKTCEANECAVVGGSNWACNGGTGVWTKCATTETCAAGACVATNALSLNITPSSNPVTTGGTTTVTFNVKKASDATPISGATVTVTSISCGTLPNPGSTTDASGNTTSTFTAPGTAAVCIINAKAILATYTDGAATASINVTVCTGSNFAEFQSYRYAKNQLIELDGLNPDAVNNFYLCIYNDANSLKQSNSYVTNFPQTLSYTASTLGTWKGLAVAGTGGCPATFDATQGCPASTEVVECEDNADCTAPATCNLSTYTCVAAAATPNCSQLACGGTVTNATCMCGAQLVSANGDYCCAASNYYGDITTCKNASNCNIADPPPGCTPNGCGGGCPASCTGADDPDCSGACLDATCVTDTDCAAAIPAATCSGPGMFVSPLGPGYCTIGEILTNATNWILALVASIIILIIVIGGLMYISSSGDEEKLRTSKNIIFYAVIGLGIILISYALITEVTDILKGP
ncbi:MAG: hypothetical protein V1732_03000 [Patescibacteria group bacterium]